MWIIFLQDVMKNPTEMNSDYITGQTGSLSKQQRECCLEAVWSLRDSTYRHFFTPIQSQLKVFYSQLWTNVWLEGSLPVIDSLLICLDQQLTDFSDLKPSCREVLLSLVHHDIILQYVKRMMKTSKKTQEQQVSGACRMTEDAEKINSFFAEACEDSSRLSEVLYHVAELLQLQDPQSVQLEMVCLARKYPDLSDVHVSALLTLKSGLSAAEIRSIRNSVEENRHLESSANHSPPFFSKIKVTWLSSKINQMGPISSLMN